MLQESLCRAGSLIWRKEKLYQKGFFKIGTVKLSEVMHFKDLVNSKHNAGALHVPVRTMQRGASWRNQKGFIWLTFKKIFSIGSVHIAVWQYRKAIARRVGLCFQFDLNNKSCLSDFGSHLLLCALWSQQTKSTFYINLCIE